jgi:glucosamine-6-phosphate deaminase
MQLFIHANANSANAAAADHLAGWLTSPGVRNVMLAGGNTPLELYRRIGDRKVPLSHLTVFALDEYVGVPLDEPRNCANVIRRTAVEPWGVPGDRYFRVSSLAADALASIQRHEQRIAEAGGLDVVVLGLGQNAHLGFNEPGSAEDSAGRVVDLDSISIEANRQWFGGDYAPARGVTVGMKALLAARRVLLLAYGAHKAGSVQAMLTGPRTAHCPASLLQGHAHTSVFLDQAAAGTTSRARALTTSTI